MRLSVRNDENWLRALVVDTATELWRIRSRERGKLRLRYPDEGLLGGRSNEYAVLLAASAVLDRTGLYYSVGTPEPTADSPTVDRAPSSQRSSVLQINTYGTHGTRVASAHIEISIGATRVADLEQGVARLIRSGRECLWLCVLERMSRSTMPALMGSLRVAAQRELGNVAAVRGLVVGILVMDPALAFVTRIPLRGDAAFDGTSLGEATDPKSLGDPDIWTAVRYLDSSTVALDRPLSWTDTSAPAEPTHGEMVTEPGADFSLVFCPGLSKNTYLLLHILEHGRFTLDGFGLERVEYDKPDCTWNAILHDYAEDEIEMEEDYVPSARYRAYWVQRLIEANQTLDDGGRLASG